MAVNIQGETAAIDGGEDAVRPLGRAIKRGLYGRCPHCGDGKLFRAFLKPVDRCANCQEDYRPQRADDLPPYLVIFIVGHIVIGGYMMTDLVWLVPTWVHMAIWVPLTLFLSLIMMQPIKGGVIGLQWALRMHGFGRHGEEGAPGQ